MKFIAKICVSLSLILSMDNAHAQISGLESTKAESVIVDSNGKYVVAGSAVVNGMPQAFIARYTSAGVLDTTFGSTGFVPQIVGDNAVFNAVIQQSNGQYVAGGWANLTSNPTFLNPNPAYNATPQFIVVRYNSNGTIDTNFGYQGIVTAALTGTSTSVVNAIAQQSNGLLVIAGYSISAVDVPKFFTARLNTNGTFDTNFNNTGYVLTGDATSAIGTNLLIQSNGDIVVTGNNETTFVAMRYTSTGALDTTFGTSGIATITYTPTTLSQCNASVLQSNGSIVLGGFNTNNFALARLTGSGVLDTTFGTSGWVITSFPSSAAIYDMVLQSNGQVVAAGYMDGQGALARYTTGGVLDSTYGTSGQVATQVGPMARILGAALESSSGKVVVAGYANTNLFLSRYSTAGVLDTTLGGTGATGANGVVTAPNVCPTALCAYGQVYNVSSQDILNNALFTFDTAGMLYNISFTPPSSYITFEIPGTYMATYIVEIEGNSLLELQLNGNAIPGSNYLDSTTSTTVGKTIFNANTGDVLSLINLTGYDQPLNSGGINTCITLEKIA